MQILRRPELERRLGVSRSTIFAWTKAGHFPHPIKLGQRAIGWRSSDIDAWLAGRMNVSTPSVPSEK